MLRYMLKRILQAIPLLLVISILCFTLIQLAPFDVIDTIATPDMSPAERDALRARYGLDQSPVVQFFRWLSQLLSGNMGYSIVTHQSVSEGFLSRLPNTILLILPSYTIAILIAVVLGLISGSKRGGWADKVIDTLCSIGMATPTFWIGMLLIYLMAYQWRIFPVLGMHSVGMEDDLGDLIRHMVLPVTVLVIGNLPSTIRFVRSSAITQYGEDYVTVQKAFGASRAQVLFRHVMKNVLLPVITLVGMSLPSLVTGAFITESLFSWPGVGTYFLTAIQAFDYPVVMTVMFFSSVLVVVGNLLADLAYGLVDPRIKTGG